MNITEAKDELKKRYKFIYDNACFIMFPIMDFDNIKNNPSVSFKADNKACSVIEGFLLGDKPFQKTSFYKIVYDLKHDNDYSKQYTCKMLEEFYFYSDYGEKLGLSDDLAMRGVNYLLDLVSYYVESGLRSDDLKDKKLDILRQYYNLNGEEDIKRKDNEKVSYDKNYNIYSGLGQSRSYFIDIVSDSSNYSEDCDTLLSVSEKEKLLCDIAPNKYDIKENKIYRKN